jgi:elongation factor 3
MKLVSSLCVPNSTFIYRYTTDVREAAELAMAEFPKKLSEFSVRACLKPIFIGFNSQFWQSKMAALNLVDNFVTRNKKAVAACLPEMIPELAQVMVDMRDEVKAGAVFAS